jgi:hypothetical protein
MGIREQKIEIGYSIKTIVRCVYHLRNNDRLKFQTGYVQYDNNEIPVWRPFDPNDKSMDAPWRKGKWENIYVLRMPHKKGSKHVEYEVSEVDFEGTSIALPKVSTELMHAFKTYLKKVNG